MASPQQFAARLQARAQAYQRAVMKAESQTRKDALAEARRLSSGPYSLLGLKKAGHPFSRRAPNGAFNPAVINLGGGRGTYKSRWKGQGPRVVGGDVVTSIANSDPNAAAFLQGTSKMVDRWGPQKKAILAKVQPAREKRLRAIKF